MQVKISPKSGYASTEITKPPPWHGLVAWDLLFNNLTTGLFLVMALGELVKPASFAPLGKVAYPVALLILLADLSCLVLDLGKRFKFHHMLRVFKPSSPMSLGTWCLTVYSLPLTALAAIDLLTALGVLPRGSAWLDFARKASLIIGLVPALGSAVYKGVLFSTSSQPGWRDGRWLGAYLVNSALMLGCAELLVIAHLMGQGRATLMLHAALLLSMLIHLPLLALFYSDFRHGLRRLFSLKQLMLFLLIANVVGFLVPLGLTITTAGTLIASLTLGLLLVGSMAIRWTLVMLPHAAH